MTIANSVLDLIGNTPVLKMARFSPAEGAQIFGKMEMSNPGGSVKDRVGLGMIEAAEKSGALKAGGTIIEPTAGNTGIGLAVVGLAKGYKVICVMPAKFSIEKQTLIQTLGGTVVRTPTKEGMEAAINKAKELNEEIENSVVLNQFFNMSNPDTHYATTGPEIWEQMEGKVDVFVAGAGTGGTFTGVARYLKEKNPDLRVVLVEPEGSIFAGGEEGSHIIEGIGNSFIPDTLTLALADEIATVKDEDSIGTVVEVARTEGILIGGSSGAACFAAKEVAAKLGKDKHVVCILPDGAERYISKGYLAFDADGALQSVQKAEKKTLDGQLGFATKAIHCGQEPEPATGAVVTPVYLTSTYAQKAPGEHSGYEYSRTKNPTRTALEENVAALEEGHAAFAFASGMAAITTLLQMYDTDSHIVVSENVYGGTYRVFEKLFKRQGYHFSYVDSRSSQAVASAINEKTKLIFLETPTNPMLHVADISKICELAHGKGVKVVVDNTFLTPYFQRPITLGADFVVHSATKYLGGHSDLVAGLIVTATHEDEEKIQFLQNSAGAILDPFQAWLCLRGIKTLAPRMELHQHNAQSVAQFLETHDKVKKVIYPWLASHPQHELACEQTTGAGGVVTFEMTDDVNPRYFLAKLEYCTLAESLGAVETLISVPSIMTHASVPKEKRLQLGILDNLVRISVGLEDIDDIIGDLDNAL